MIDFIKELDAIWENDPLGLLEVQPRATTRSVQISDWLLRLKKSMLLYGNMTVNLLSAAI